MVVRVKVSGQSEREHWAELHESNDTVTTNSTNAHGSGRKYSMSTQKKVHSHMHERGDQHVNWLALRGDKGFRAGLVMNRVALRAAKEKIDEISVPKTDLQWRERLDGNEYRLMRLHQMEKPFVGKYCSFALTRKEDGIFRCKGCGNFLFDSHQILGGKTPYLSFDQPLDGGLIQSQNPKASNSDIDCSICHSFVGKLTRRGFEVNSASVVFDPMLRSELNVVRKMCINRWRRLAV